MKELCDRLMKLNPDLPYGIDYSPLALALFLKEESFSKEKEYSIEEFAKYLYRFYSDIPEAKLNHYYNLINELWHYQPYDFIDYARSVLVYVKDTTGLIAVGKVAFALAYCPEDVGKYTQVLSNVLRVLITKYIGSKYQDYDSRIKIEEFQNKSLFTKDDRVFYRALENLNYCFITDERDLNKLSAIRLKEKESFDYYNYLVLEKGYGDLYLKKKLIIKKNGYPYIDNKRLFEHIEISVLRKIRNNLSDK